MRNTVISSFAILLTPINGAIDSVDNETLSSHLSAKGERILKDVFKMLCGLIVFFAKKFVPAAIWAANPLISDDSGTQGNGKYQLELNAQLDFDKEAIAGVTVESWPKELATVLSYGATNSLDLVVGIP